MFKAWKTEAEIERLQANIGQDLLILAQEDYGHQPVGKGSAVGKTKQTGSTLGDPKQNDLFAADKVSGYVQDKEN